MMYIGRYEANSKNVDKGWLCVWYAASCDNKNICTTKQTVSQLNDTRINNNTVLFCTVTAQWNNNRFYPQSSV